MVSLFLFPNVLDNRIGTCNGNGISMERGIGLSPNLKKKKFIFHIIKFQSELGMNRYTHAIFQLYSGQCRNSQNPLRGGRACCCIVGFSLSKLHFFLYKVRFK